MRLQEKKRVLCKMEFQKSCNTQGYKTWSAAQGHTDPLFSCLGPVIIKKKTRGKTSLKYPRFDGILKEHCQLHWHGNSYCNLDATRAQRGGKEFIGQLAFQNAPCMKTGAAAIF